MKVDPKWPSKIFADRTLRILGLFGAFWGKVWALGAKVWDPSMRVQEH